MITKMPHMEINSQPSMLNTASGSDGVPAALQKTLDNPPKYDGIKIEDMRDNPLYTKHDEIDKIGLAQQKIAEAAKAVSKSKFVRELNRKMQHPNKPKDSTR